MLSDSFETLSDDDLHVAVRRLTARSNVALADLLAHLGEVESRGIHRTKACASLYTYCIYELRMSEDAAYRRSKAARFVREYPDLHGVVARGELHLTGLLMVGPHLGGERHTEILERARFRTKRELLRLVAELDPKSPVPAAVEPIGPAHPLRAPTWEQYMESLAGPVLSLRTGDRPEDWIVPESTDVADAERALEKARDDAKDPHSTRPLRYKVQFTAEQEYVDLLMEAANLLGLRRRATSMPQVQLLALRDLVERLRKQKRGAPVAERRIRPAAESEVPMAAPCSAPAREPEPPNAAPARASGIPSTSRYIPVPVRRAVWNRDESRCAYTDDRGHRCTEMLRLEVHHRKPFARGGSATEPNLELRCRSHNLLAAEQDFGREQVLMR